jgi:hypothetical protein
MSDETLPNPENPLLPISENVPSARRNSSPRPTKKVAKKASKTKAEPALAAEPPAATVEEKSETPPPLIEREDHSEAPAITTSDWPEPEAASTGGNQSTPESTKRKRRRRKGKGQSAAPPNAAPLAMEDIQSIPFPETKPVEGPQDQRPRPNPNPPQAPRLKVDPEVLHKMAWKIYLAEVSEEGVALIGDGDARDLSRRCFRLAEIFIEEQSRRS